MQRDLVIGIDLGGTHMQVGIVRPDGTILHRDGAKTLAEEGPDAVISRIAETIRQIADSASIDLARIAGIGIGAPGAIDPDTGIVLEAPNLGWYDINISQALSKRMNAVPVLVDNDVNVAVLGENTFGAGKRSRHVLGVWVGTGIGGGIILDGSLFRGGMGTAGEIGQTTLLPDLPRGKEKMEQHCSRKFLTLQIEEALAQGKSSSISALIENNERGITASHIARAYEQSDELVVGIVNRGADLLGLSIANAVTLLSLPLVLLGGGLTESMGEPYIRRVTDAMRRHIFPKSLAQRVEVRATTLQDNAGLLGGAMLALEHTGLNPTQP